MFPSLLETESLENLSNMRAYKLESKSEKNSKRPYQGLEYEAVNTGPQQPEPVQRMEDNNEVSAGQTDGEIVQMVRAFRVGTTLSNYKVVVDPESGNITEFKGGKSGIDISFESREHALYYLQTKSGDSNAKLVEWEMDDNLYAMIKRRMGLEVKGKVPASWIAPKKGKPGRLAALWTKIQKISKPVNSTDKIVVKNNLIAPHFGLDWIPIFNKAGKGRATVTGHEEEESTPAATFQATDWVALNLNDGSGWLPLQYSEVAGYTDDMKSNEFSVLSKAEAITETDLVDGDFI